MKKLNILILTVSLLFLTSCSYSSYVPSNDFSYISADIIPEEAPITENSSLLNAENVKLNGASVSSLSVDNVTVYFPLFENADINDIISEQIRTYLDTLDTSSHSIFDFFVSNGQECISFVFYDSTSVSSSLRNVFSVTFTNDFNELCGIDKFINANDPLEHISETVDKLYGGKGAFKSNSDVQFYVDAKGITVIDSLGYRFTIPKDNFNGRASRKVVVGDSYTPVQANEKVIALTFDDGPNAKYTSNLLSVLKEKDVKATFFTVGYNIPNNEYLLRRMIEQGCDVGIHSYGHQNYLSMSRDEIMDDINKCSELIKNATDIAPHLVRAPFGNIPDEIVAEQEYYFINWNVDRYDWKSSSAKEIYDHVMKYARSGSIVLLHDLYTVSCEATAMIIDKLKSDGWRFVTVSEMFDMKNNLPSGEIYYGLGH